MSAKQENQLESTEVALLELWRGILEVDQLAPDDDFFAVGGDSLKGVRLLAEVNQVFGVDIPPLTMYDEASSVSAMAKYIAGLREST